LKKLEKEVKKEEMAIPWYKNLSIPTRRLDDASMPPLFDDGQHWFSLPTDFGLSEDLGLLIGDRKFEDLGFSIGDRK
jgi:hypothetical protein